MLSDTVMIGPLIKSVQTNVVGTLGSVRSSKYLQLMFSWRYKSNLNT